MQIFFSYGHDKHGAVVKRLADEIEAQSGGRISVWIDEHNITAYSHWRERITDGILSSESVIAFLSSHSAREESVCRDELSIALVSKHGMIRTVLLESPDTFTPPSRVSEYQWADMSDYTAVMQQGDEAFDEYIRSKAAELAKLVSSDEMQRYSDEARQLRSCLQLPEIDDWTKFDEMIDKELIGREWLFDRVSQWENDAAAKNILMIYGKAGSGKSMFSAHLSLRDPAVAAAFPCDCRHEEYSTANSIIANIAYRLALRLPDYRAFVLKRLGGGDFDIGSDKLFDRLILQPLSSCNIDGSRASLVIVVDALDEMRSDRLADFIRSSANTLRKYVRFIITSRRLPEITERFAGFPEIDIDTVTDEGNADIRAYCESRLHDAIADSAVRERIVSQLTERSSLMFTYAECMCSSILADIAAGSFDADSFRLPDGIGELFRQTLDRSFAGRMSSYTSDAAPALGMMLASPEPISAATLKALLDWRDRDLKAFRAGLSSFIIETDGRLSFFHRAFGEWLETTDTAYGITREDGLNELADACFDIYSECPEDMDEYMLVYFIDLLQRSSGRKRSAQLRAVSGDDAFIGRLNELRDTFYKRREYYRALKISGALINLFPNNEEYVESYINVSSWAGFEAFEKGSEEEVAVSLEILETVRRISDRKPDDIKTVECYFYALEKTMRAYNRNGNTAKEEELARESVQYRRALFEERPEDSNRYIFYSRAMTDAFQIYCENGKPEDAIACMEELRQKGRKLAEDYSGNEDIVYRYGMDLTTIGIYYKDLFMITEAKECLEEAITVSQSFYSERFYELWESATSIHGGCIRNFPYGEDTDKVYTQRLNELRPKAEHYLHEKVDDDEYLKLLSEFCYKDFITKERAEEIDRELVGHCRRRLALSVGDPHEDAICLHGILKAANDSHNRGLAEASDAYYRERLEQSKQLMEKYPDRPGYRIGYWNGLGYMAEHLKSIHDYAGAEAFYRKKLEMVTEDFENDDDEAAPFAEEYVYTMRDLGLLICDDELIDKARKIAMEYDVDITEGLDPETASMF